MLRLSYMHSDFHPVLLVLGDPDELRKFAALIEAFAADGSTLRVDQAEGIAALDTDVTLSQDAGRPGLWRNQSTPASLSWTLRKDQAAVFARDVRDLAESGVPSGSVTLECDILNEIKVKVSLGEFEDHFLTGTAR